MVESYTGIKEACILFRNTIVFKHISNLLKREFVSVVLAYFYTP